VRPWTDEDARGRCAVLLEDDADAIEFELALAWLASTGNPGAALVAPLVKRAGALLKRGGDPLFAALLLAACDPAFEFFPQTWRRDSHLVVRDGQETWEAFGDPLPNLTAEERSPIPLLVTRLREVVDILQGRAPRRVLLATPGDSQGWIEPAVFRERFLAHGGIAPFPADLTQALLRLRPEGREAVLGELGLTMPPVTAQIRVEWRSHGSASTKPNGEPMWVWWGPFVKPASPAQAAQGMDAASPAVIQPWPDDDFWRGSMIDALPCAEVALIHPPSTLPLVEAGIGVMNSAAGDDATPTGAEHVLRALSRHPGAWTVETAQLLALGMSAKHAEIRAQAAELLAAAVPARIAVAAAAEGFAACAVAVVLNRWAHAFRDAASLAPAAVIDLLAALLPRLDPKARGLGALLTVLLDEATRQRHLPASDTLAAWLAQFSGASASAKAARAIQALSTPKKP
jgi:hypothetical protein